MRTGNPETRDIVGQPIFFVGARRDNRALNWVAFVILAVVSGHCSQTRAADALADTTNRNAITTNYAQINPMAEQLLEMKKISRQQSRADKAIKLEALTMSQARIDALLLKNSIMHMVSSLDRYRVFAGNFHR